MARSLKSSEEIFRKASFPFREPLAPQKAFQSLLNNQFPLKKKFLVKTPTMRISSVKIAFVLGATWTSSSAFQVFTTAPLRTYRSNSGALAMSTVTDSYAKQELVATAEKLKGKYGVFLTDKEAKSKLLSAVEKLEKEARTTNAEFLGDWTLLCTCSSVEQPDFFPTSPIRESLARASNKFVKVQQCVRSTEDNGVVDRIDNVIQYETPGELGSVFKDLPEQLSHLKIFNPLKVSKGKVILCHKAEVLETYGDGSLFTTKIKLHSVILNVAGQSTVLEPEGSDVLSLNVPGISDFTNSGTFETTYMDDTVRISRGKLGFVDQLRVFVRVDGSDGSYSFKDSIVKSLEEGEMPTADEEDEG